MAAAPATGELQQWLMCWLVSGQALCNNLPRFGLPFLLPFLAAELRLTLRCHPPSTKSPPASSSRW